MCQLLNTEKMIGHTQNILGSYLVKPRGPHDDILLDGEHIFWRTQRMGIHLSNFDSLKGLVWEYNPVHNIKAGYDFTILIKCNLFTCAVVK